MPTNVYRTNAAIVCKDFELLQQCADQKGVDWGLLTVGNQEKFVQELQAASSGGLWVACDALEVGVEILREAIHAVWLQTPWHHHENFRFWVIDGPLRQVTIANGKREQEMLPFILSKSAMFLTYTHQFTDEFVARDLVSCVEDSYLAGVELNNVHIRHLQSHDIVMLFRRCKKEEIFLALCQGGSGAKEESAVNKILQARSMGEGKSVLDVAIEKDYRNSASLLRDFGCKSECFDFQLLVDPSFAPMLTLLLDPWKPFPFDPKESSAKIASANSIAILKQLFNCRIDVSFEGSDYPLAEACSTENMDLVYVVLDRMSTTGVHPCSDYRLATYFINRILTVDFLNRGKQAVTRRRSRADLKSGNFVGEGETYQEDLPIPLTSEQLIQVAISEVSMEILLKLTRAVILEGEEVKVGYTVDAIRRASAYPELIHAMLQSVDVRQTDHPEDLLSFFIQFDPENVGASEITRMGLEMVGQSGAPDVDDRTFDFIAQMLRVGPSAVPMARSALQLAVARDYMPLTYRRKPGPPGGGSLATKSKSFRTSTVAIVGEPGVVQQNTPSPAATQPYLPPYATTTPNDTKTLMMIAMEYPPNLPGLLAVMEVCSPHNMEKVVNQVDDAQCNVLKRLVAELTQSSQPELRGVFLSEYADGIKYLLDAGCDAQVEPPMFNVPLFTFAARQDLGEVCYELLDTRPHKDTSLILSCTANLQALMVNRYLRLLAPLLREAKPQLQILRSRTTTPAQQPLEGGGAVEENSNYPEPLADGSDDNNYYTSGTAADSTSLTSTPPQVSSSSPLKALPNRFKLSLVARDRFKAKADELKAKEEAEARRLGIPVEGSSGNTAQVNWAVKAAAAHLVPLDTRINPPLRVGAGQSIRRTVSSEFSLPLLGVIVSWLPIADRPALMVSDTTWYYASLGNHVWIQPSSLLERAEHNVNEEDSGGEVIAGGGGVEADEDAEETELTNYDRPTYLKSAWQCCKVARITTTKQK